MSAPHATSLPNALKPWSDWLQGFDATQLEALGAMLLPMHRALGPYRAPPSKGRDEPNGYDDLQRRGPYDRLLISEWLLADELPDEFLRRAGANEHLFLATRRDSARVDRRMIAIFDDGALQLGSPRLAHIALWILLARRAAEAGATFEWATLHMNAFPPGESAPSALKRLVHARRLVRDDGKRLQRWMQTIAAGAPATECWLVGCPQIAGEPAVPGLTHHVLIDRDLSAHLAIDILGPGYKRRIRVPVPGDHAAQSLLRGRVDEYRPATHVDTSGVPTRFDPRCPPVFGRRGSSIMLATNDHRALIYRRPKPLGKPRRPQMHAFHGTSDLIAIATNSHVLGCLSGSERRLTGHGLGKLERWGDDESLRIAVPVAPASWQHGVFFDSWNRHQLFFVDAANVLFEWRDSAVRGMSEVKWVANNVLSISRGSNAQLIYAFASQGRITLRGRTRLGVDEALSTLDLDSVSVEEEPSRVVINGWSSGVWDGVWAISRAQRHADGGARRFWELRKVFTHPYRSPASRASRTIELADGEDVLGIVAPHNMEPALVVKSANGCTLHLVPGDARQTLFTSAQPFAAVTVASDCNLIAVVTFDQRLVVLEPGGRDPVEWPAPLQGRMT